MKAIPWHYAVDIQTGEASLPGDERLVRYSDYTTLAQEVETLRRDIETGFMEGAYARLKNLQEVERAAHDKDLKIKRLEALLAKATRALLDVGYELKCADWGRLVAEGKYELLARHEEAAPQGAEITRYRYKPESLAPLYPARYGELVYYSDEDGWQPIETAPKDKPILVSGGTYSYSDGMYGEVPFMGVSIAYWDHDHWHGENNQAHDEWDRHKPTHWMPLPSPPASKGEGE